MPSRARWRGPSRQPQPQKSLRRRGAVPFQNCRNCLSVPFLPSSCLTSRGATTSPHSCHLEIERELLLQGLLRLPLNEKQPGPHIARYFGNPAVSGRPDGLSATSS